MANKACDTAVRRLDAAMVEQHRLRGRFDAAIGTTTEFAAWVRLKDAGEQVSARAAWVNWVREKGYRGLNAGPFELRAEDHVVRSHKTTGS